MNRDEELDLIRTLTKRLQRTEREIAALSEPARARVREYLAQRYGWFIVDPPSDQRRP